MMTRQSLRLCTLLTLLSLLLVLSGCAGMGGLGATTSPVTIDDLPVVEGATALQPGEDPVADTLAQNMSQDAAIRASAGAGGSTEQRAYRLAADTSWEAIQAFYSEQLTASGWQSGLGGPGGSIMEEALAQSNSAGGAQMAFYSRGNQTLTLIRTPNPSDTSAEYLILSLSTN